MVRLGKSGANGMSWSGHCTLSQQLLWATQMQAWYSTSFVEKFVTTDLWMGNLDIAQDAAERYYYGEDTSWFWGNVTKDDLAKYKIVQQVFHDPPTYPGKPYFIVYEFE